MSDNAIDRSANERGITRRVAQYLTPLQSVNLQTMLPKKGAKISTASKVRLDLYQKRNARIADTLRGTRPKTLVTNMRMGAQHYKLFVTCMMASLKANGTFILDLGGDVVLHILYNRVQQRKIRSSRIEVSLDRPDHEVVSVVLPDDENELATLVYMILLTKEPIAIGSRGQYFDATLRPIFALISRCLNETQYGQQFHQLPPVVFYNKLRTEEARSILQRVRAAVRM